MTSTAAKPPGLSAEHAAQFQDASIVRAYAYRQPYPPETFELLADIAGVNNPAILDLGCGTGDVTVGLSQFAGTIDAVDLSDEMIATAKVRKLARNNVRWIVAPAEVAPVSGPYDLVTAGESLHWMDWPAVFSKLKSVVKPGSFVAIVGREYAHRSWWNPEFQAIIDRHSTNKEYKTYNLLAELAERGLWHVAGNKRTEPIAFRQTVDELIEAFHSRNGFSRDRMGREGAHEFDEQAALHLAKFAVGNGIELGATGRVTWGTVA